MTQEEKQLLLKDLCARLPYGVKVHINSPIDEQNQMELFDVSLESETVGVGNDKWAFRAVPIIDDEDETKVIKPYLRPMSSMTEEEKMHFWCLNHNPNTGADFMTHAPELIDWLNENHFDYRGLIEKGLALEATEEMYKTE